MSQRVLFGKSPRWALVLIAITFWFQCSALRAETPPKGVVVWCENLDGLCRWFPNRPEERFWEADHFERYREFREFREGWIVLRKHIHPHFGSLLVLNEEGETVLQFNLPMSGPLREVTGEFPDGSLLLCNNSEHREEGVTCPLILNSRGTHSTLFEEGTCAFPSFSQQGRFTCLRDEEQLEIVSGLFPSLSKTDASLRTSRTPNIEHHGIGAFEVLNDGEYVLSDGTTVWVWEEGKEAQVLKVEEPRWVRRENGEIFLGHCTYVEEETEESVCSVSRIVSGGGMESIWSSPDFQPGNLYGLGDGSFLLEVMTEERREDLLVLTLPCGDSRVQEASSKRASP